MWQYSDDEFVKVYRKITSWEWYTDVPAKVLFLHCVVKANWKDAEWKGIKLKRGQFVTSLNSLSLETGLTTKQVRLALEKLVKTNELRAQSERGKNTIITVLAYDNYQGQGKTKAKKGQNEGKTRAIDIRSKEEKKKRNNNIAHFSNERNYTKADFEAMERDALNG